MNYNSLKTKSKVELIQLCILLDAKRRKGWSMYYNTENMLYQGINIMAIEIEKIKTEYKEDNKTDKETIPNHIIEEYKGLIQRYEDFKKECPICMEKMLAKDMKMTNCGHIFHDYCYDMIALPRKCPICRKV